jgi:hypothetical protein
MSNSMTHLAQPGEGYLAQRPKGAEKEEEEKRDEAKKIESAET